MRQIVRNCEKPWKNATKFEKMRQKRNMAQSAILSHCRRISMLEQNATVANGALPGGFSKGE